MSALIAFPLVAGIAVTLANVIGGPDFGTAFTAGLCIGCTMGVIYAYSRIHTMGREIARRDREGRP